MKQECLDHSKTIRLAQLLGVEMWGAVGILESLWHRTSKEAPRGDIGKIDDKTIAKAIGWLGDAHVLIDALVEARWIENDKTHRLVIHGWSEHAQDSVHNKLARARDFFCDGKAPKVSGLQKEEREEAKAFYTANTYPTRTLRVGNVKPTRSLRITVPNHTLPNHTKPSPPTPSGLVGDASPENLNQLEQVVIELGQKIHDRHPAVRRCGVTEIRKQLSAIAKTVPAKDRIGLLKTVDENHAAYCASEQWQRDDGQYAKGLENWLAPTKHRWESPPPRGEAIAAPSINRGLFIQPGEY